MALAHPLTADRLFDQKNPVTLVANPPTCVGCSKPPEIYKSYAPPCSSGKTCSPSLPVNDPSQIVEYSLGAIPATNLAPPNPKYYLQTNNVDFDISYVNFAYLPGLVESYISPPDTANINGSSNYPGYYGSPKSISTVRQDIARFLGQPGASAYKGWPQFVSPSTNVQGCLLPGGQEELIKVPAPLQIFASMECTACNTPETYNQFSLPAGVYTEPTCPPVKVTIGSTDYQLLAAACLWPPIKRLADLWIGCTADTSDQSVTCRDIRTVNSLFLANYASYTAHYADVVDGKYACDQAKGPIPLNGSTLLGHVYGWTPFNDGCPAQWNTLEGGHVEYPQFPTNPDYPTQKMTFDRLNKGKELALNDKQPLFNPYVRLVHDPFYVDAENVYAYSVDDALGNFQGEGTGLIIAMGGTKGLPNPNAATSPVYLQFGGTEHDPVHFTNYSICNDRLNHVIDYKFDSVLNIWNTKTPDIMKCPIALGDNIFNTYSVTILRGPPYPPPRQNGSVPIFSCGIPGTAGCFTYIDPKTNNPVQFIDCTDNTPGSFGASWCNNITVHTVTDYNLKESNYVVGGAPNQPNPNGPDYSRDFMVTLGDSIAGGRPLWKDFAACQDTSFTRIDAPLGSDSPSFIVDTVANNISATHPCTVTVRDVTDRRYQFTVVKAVPWEKATPKQSIFTCAKGESWCNGIVVTVVNNPNPLLRQFVLETPPPDPSKN